MSRSLFGKRDLDGNSVTLDSEATGFELTLDALPPFYTVVGDVNGRIAYGSVVVFSDADGDGILTILPQTSLEKPKGGDGKDDEMEDAQVVDGWVSDRVVASSFYHLQEPQVRLVHKEGAFDLSSNFLPAQNCRRGTIWLFVVKTIDAR